MEELTNILKYLPQNLGEECLNVSINIKKFRNISHDRTMDLKYFDFRYDLCQDCTYRPHCSAYMVARAIVGKGQLSLSCSGCGSNALSRADQYEIVCIKCGKVHFLEPNPYYREQNTKCQSCGKKHPRPKITLI